MYYYTGKLPTPDVPQWALCLHVLRLHDNNLLFSPVQLRPELFSLPILVFILPPNCLMSHLSSRDFLDYEWRVNSSQCWVQLWDFTSNTQLFSLFIPPFKLLHLCYFVQDFFKRLEEIIAPRKYKTQKCKIAQELCMVVKRIKVFVFVQQISRHLYRTLDICFHSWIILLQIYRTDKTNKQLKARTDLFYFMFYIFCISKEHIFLQL